MTYQQADNMDMKDKKYYSLYVWEDANKSGEQYKNVYFRKGNAEKRFAKLLSSDKYQRIVLREEDVSVRNATTEISSSSAIDIWENNMRPRMVGYRDGAMYIDCDLLLYYYTEEYKNKYNPKYGLCVHSRLWDYESRCNCGYWRDGNFYNAIIALKYRKETDALVCYKDHKLIMVITRDTPEELYYRHIDC